MKFKFMCSLMATICLAGTIGGTAWYLNENNKKKPVKAGVVVPRPQIKYVVDTLLVTDSNFDKLNGRAAAGVFVSSCNKVVVYYFKTDSKKRHIKNYCEKNNRNMPLTLRHESEHARKAMLTKGMDVYSPHTRGAVAAMNEIMAPAAEIIEAVDQEFVNKKPFPASKVFTKEAAAKIADIAFANGYGAPADFKNQEIADITLDYALSYFLGQIKAGTYITTIRNTVDMPQHTYYVPNAETDVLARFMFFPDFNMWGPMFTYDTRGGRVDIWDTSSVQMRRKMINSVDSVVNSVKSTGQIPLLINMQKNY